VRGRRENCQQRERRDRKHSPRNAHQTFVEAGRFTNVLPTSALRNIVR
jgi:hypothetical protein